ncbi:MerR family transcriptional regulator [Romboutsia sp. 1001216sp1]|uniref:MerR family transcriptional regulator n=1 Tax=unclassified Romboutsia TaxID=2626894 RepID=UPI001A9BA36B|nr:MULTISPECIES: MerR family transcriptional regulator [unclassified Romboutsia]MDB8792055.1 MerR family transcriptional regulator [Romboutsia sp. 1001216sp1]MDB8801427.1 MerR family transcriptional regulator [Romboutsia sp. 1001216sp1]MDB8812825.1 MerR family transcriptional regulator [Romboutsia sp. 1001216sp1]
MKLLTGQVSKIFNISKDTLRYYDKMGLLKPDINKSNGYRYYSQEHIDQLNLILATKDLDISLADIKETIESEELYKYKELVNKQEKLIEEKIESLKRKQKQLKKWNEILDIVINFENEYDFNNIKVYRDTYSFYLINLDKILEKDFNKEYIGCIDEVLECMNEECYYTMYNLNNGKGIEEDESNILIKEDEKNISIIKKYMDKNLNLIHREISGDFICVKFYGNSDELNDYLLRLSKHFNKKENNEVFIKCGFYIPKKNNDEKYFVEILLKV